MNTPFSAPHAQPCQFGEWHFDPTDGQLKTPTKQVRLQPRLSTLLALMVANVDVLLTREMLIEQLWPDKIVNEDALSRCIAQLRSTLGDDSKAPIYIETIPKKGYRFIKPLVVAPTSEKPQRLVFAAVAFVLITVFFIFNLPTDSAQSTADLKTALLSAKRVTADTALEHQPELSNQGDKIAFMVRQGERLVVKIVNLEGELLHLIEDPEQHLYSPTFANDDQSLLVAGLNKGQCTIYQVQLPSLQRQERGACLAVSISGIFDWSMDGSSFAYVAAAVEDQEEGEKEESTAIWTYHISTQQHQQVTQPSGENEYDTRPKYSPDGKQLAFTRGTESVRNIYTLSLEESGEVTALTQARGFISGFDWLKDSRQLIFDSNVSGERNLWLVDTALNKQTLLGARDARYPSLNRNNSRLVFQEIRYNANIWQVNTANDNSEPAQIIKSIKYNNFPAFSPDGRHIAFISNRQGKSALWLYEDKSQQQRKLLAIPELDLFSPSWSADGNQLLVSSRGPEGYRCYQVNANTGEYQAILAITEPHNNCIYTKAGDILAVIKAPSQLAIILKLTHDGKVQQLLEQAVSRIQLTETGKIIYSLADKAGLYAMDMQGDNKQIILADFSHHLDGDWTVQGNALYYPKVGEEQGEDRGVWQRDLITGNEIKVTSQLPSAIGLTISVSPDHGQLVFSQTDSRLADIYLSVW